MGPFEIIMSIGALAIFCLGVVSTFKWVYKLFTKKKVKPVKVPVKNQKYQPMDFDYASRLRESDLLHTATIIYANDSLGALDIDTAVEKADLLIKSVGALLKKERDLQAFKLGISDPWVD